MGIVMATKLTNDIVDARLIQDNRDITRVGEYINAATKMEWECKTCNHHWHTTANSVLNLKSGCPNCYGNVKYTNADIDGMITAGIKRVGRTCDHTWTSSPNGVITKQTGCPICSFTAAGINKSAREANRVVNMLKERNVSTVQPFNRVVDKYDFVCGVCNHSWNTAMNNLLNSNTGCPKCAGYLPLTNKEVDARLKQDNRPITRVGDYITATTKIKWKCHKCEKVWSATPDSVLNAKSGCNICGCLGLVTMKYFSRNPQKKTVSGYVYLVEGEYKGTRFLKIGITEHGIEQRFKQDKKYNITPIYAKQMPLYDAFVIEQMVLQNNLKSLYRPDAAFGGKTECFVYSDELKQSILDTI
jgi:predicted  nucleic acid-binding Zn-ribbon protein